MSNDQDGPGDDGVSGRPGPVLPAESWMAMYGLDHEPIDFLSGARLLGSPEARVAEDVIEVPAGSAGGVGASVRVSTVFLVHDHRHGRSVGVPVLYETMIFTPDGTPSWCERYATREAALAGHDRACAWVRAPHLAPAPVQDRLDFSTPGD